MEQKESSRLPAKIIRHLLICTAGILGFVFLVIWPYQKLLAGLDGEIKNIESQIERQEILFPIYKDLLKMVNAETLGGLPFPERAELDRDKTAEIPYICKEIARKNNLEVASVVPNLQSLAKRPGLLPITALLRGDLFDLRNFLIQLGGVPYLEHIEEIRIQSVEGYKEFRVKFWMALKK
ncbi:MAG: hypothetical protein SV775_10240 [Thermodesulfobacteriota bacterium]|nr:hypothetical protein [Thermodesulfobacteriota bacterium]